MPDNEHNDRDGREVNPGNLEEELRELGRSIEYPPTPDISQAVRSRIEEEERSPGGLWSRLPSARWAAAAALVVVMVSPFFSPAFRDSVSDVFLSGQASRGAGGGVSESAESGDSSPGSASPMGETESPASPDGGDLPDSASPAGGGAVAESFRGGERISLEEVRARAGEDGLLVPRSSRLGAPDAAYSFGPDGEEGYALVYRARPGLPPLGAAGAGLVLTVVPGEVETVYLGGKSRGQPIGVNGERGYWLSGVLFWERDGMALRLQSGLSKEEAVRFAESAR